MCSPVPQGNTPPVTCSTHAQTCKRKESVLPLKNRRGWQANPRWYLYPWEGLLTDGAAQASRWAINHFGIDQFNWTANHVDVTLPLGFRTVQPQPFLGLWSWIVTPRQATATMFPSVPLIRSSLFRLESSFMWDGHVAVVGGLCLREAKFSRTMSNSVFLFCLFMPMGGDEFDVLASIHSST
ncbi:hypothetical protein BDP81DRAFT_453956 [Colletotrichum phormii]|uniref:Uncharacterized protein n=1 Tax=Colletotrichum phormii TaxID=359342 RepID=A0AAJ0E9F6_9PEZI|nr:uncharacterized protein BDP81DRAFT_453956 [Colletotrichum phormii]KAK1623894.1 hypothetical protein BDP81DRAFT_453956 [Colletotrichum phormii]